MSQPTTSSEKRRTLWERATLAVMFVGYGALMVCRGALVAASPAMIRDKSLGLDKATFGRLMSWNSFGGLVGKLVTGVGADRLGGRKMFLIAVVMTAAATAMFGVLSHLYLFALFNFSSQFFKAGGWPAMAKIIGAWYPKKKHGQAWSIVSMSSRIGTIAAGLFLGALLLVLPWRIVFFAAAAPAMLVVVVAWFFLKDRPENVGLLSPQEDGNPGASVVKRQSHALDGTTLRQACGVFLRSPRVWLLSVSLFMLTILMDFVNFVPLYLSETLNLVAGKASMLGSVFPTGMLAALLVSSVVYDKFSRRQLVRVLGALLVTSCLCIIILWQLPRFGLSTENNMALAVGTLFVLGFSISPAYYLPMSLFSIDFGGIHSGFLIAVFDVFGYLGAIGFNFFGGAIAQSHGWSVFLTGLLLIAVLSMASTTAFLRLDRAAERPARSQEQAVET